MQKIYIPEELNSFSRETLVAVILSIIVKIIGHVETYLAYLKSVNIGTLHRKVP